MFARGHRSDVVTEGNQVSTMATDLRTARASAAARAEGSSSRRWSVVRRWATADHAWIWATALALFAIYTTVSVRLHLRILSSGFDLGIYEQALRSWAHLHWPVVELEGPGFHQLGDHFVPILATVAPIYRVFPSPVTLLVVQAALVAVAVVPLARCAQRMVGRGPAVVIAVGYGFSWGVAEAVGFDFHEVAFAAPLVAFSAVAFVEGRHTAAVAWALPLLLVKEDLGGTVAMLGALVVWAGRRRLGAATIVAGVGGSLLELLVLMPHANPHGSFKAWLDSHHGASAAGGLSGSLQRFSFGLFTPEAKVSLLLMLLVPTALVALRSPVLLLALPTLAWRLTSDNPYYWGTGYHYSLTLMPIVFVAFIDGLRRARAQQGPSRVREALLVSAVTTAILLPAHPFWALVRPSSWQHDPRVTDARAMLVRIPSGVQVAASNHLASQLTSRDEVTVFGWPPSRPNPEYLAIEDEDPVNWPFNTLDDQRQMAATAVRLGYAKIFQQGNFVLLHRSPTDSRQFPPPPPPKPAS
jgi:uncharacterized membrane protein